MDWICSTGAEAVLKLTNPQFLHKLLAIDASQRYINMFTPSYRAADHSIPRLTTRFL
jgi:hypothetical protein